MVIRTRIILGSRQTPRFVPKDFFDAMQAVSTLYQFESTMSPTTIRYHVPRHMVVERKHQNIDHYFIDLDDAKGVPSCSKIQYLQTHTFKRRIPGHVFDRFRCITEEYHDDYYLLTPNATYYNIEIFQEWSCSHVLYHDVVWSIHFRQVFVDPHDTSHTIWFHGIPKYQIEIIANKDFRQDQKGLKNAVLSILPRAFRWD